MGSPDVVSITGAQALFGRCCSWLHKRIRSMHESTCWPVYLLPFQHHAMWLIKNKNAFPFSAPCSKHYDAQPGICDACLPGLGGGPLQSLYSGGGKQNKIRPEGTDRGCRSARAKKKKGRQKRELKSHRNDWLPYRAIKIATNRQAETATNSSKETKKLLMCRWPCRVWN